MAAFVGSVASAASLFVAPATAAATSSRSAVLPRGRAAAAGGRRAPTMVERPVVDQANVDRYASLPLNGKVFAEYIWLGGKSAVDANGAKQCVDPDDIRSKTKVVDGVPSSPADLPSWNFDGSSTGQAPGDDSEVIIKPVAIYPDPFRGSPHVLVLCDCHTPQGEPIPSNTRAPAKALMDKVADQKPWFGIEQEYTLLDLDGKPLGWPKMGFPAPQGPYYCGAGAMRAIGRELADAHARACLYAGIQLSGVNLEVMLSQLEYQVGPCVGIDSGDQMWVARYIMLRLCEEFNCVASLHPKPMTEGEWNGAGCHTNFSTEPMRKDGGFEVIKACMPKLEAAHAKHIAVYGVDNDARLSGAFETQAIDKFSWGVADRGASIRVGRDVEAAGKGYFEDRRPGSNIDPYVVTAALVETCLL